MTATPRYVVGEKHPEPHPDAQGEMVVWVKTTGLTEDQLTVLDAWAEVAFGEDVIVEGSADAVAYLVPARRAEQDLDPDPDR